MSRGRAVLPEIVIADEFAGADTTPAQQAAGVLTLAGNATRANAVGTLTLVAQPTNAKAELDLASVTVNADTVVEEAAAGVAGNSTTLAFVADGTGAGTLDESAYPAIVFHFESGVTTVTNLETAIAASTHLDVKAAGTGANVLVVADDDFAATALAGGTTETVTVDARVYTFKDTLVAAGDIKIGASASITLDNLIAAINGAAGSGTLYGVGTAVHATVVAAAGAGDTMIATARASGVGGNSIATLDGMANAGNVWGAVTLIDGAVAETVTIGARVYTLVDHLTAANQVARGAAATNTIDNLIAAVNAAAGEGTTYGTGTLGHADVTAAAGAGDTMDVTADVAGELGNAIATTTTMAQGSWGAVTLVGGDMAGASIPAHQRTAKAWVIARRGAGGSGAVTVANAYLEGLIDNGEPVGTEDDGEGFIRCATLGSMNIAAGEAGTAVLVEGLGCFKHLAFNSDAIAADTIDVSILPVAD